MSEENKDYFGLNNKDELTTATENETEKTAETTEEKPAKKKAKITFSLPQVILIVVLVLLAAFAIAITSISYVKDVNPISYISGELHQAKLVNKWQSQDAPGLSAYEFYDDGTYKSYISTFSFNGNYTVKGDKLTLTNPNTGQNVVYKYGIYGNTLTMTLIEENGTTFDDREPLRFDRVDVLNQKSLSDMLDDLKEDTTEESTTEAVSE